MSHIIRVKKTRLSQTRIEIFAFGRLHLHLEVMGLESRKYLGFLPLLLLLLFATISAGLVLRWELAGELAAVSFLDWRRAHSHLGFYGVLFPISWLCLQWARDSQKFWTPPRQLFFIYTLMVAGAGIAFLVQGYAFWSILFSTGVLIVWLTFAWRNFHPCQLFQKDWSASISLSVFLSALLIFAVAHLTRHNPELAQKVARAFLTLLLFGVFTPSLLEMLEAPPPVAWLWMLATVATSLFLTGIFSSALWGLGSALLGLLLILSLARSQLTDWRLKMAWFVFAGGLCVIGLKILPYTYFRAIAGIHFIVLGPILMTFALVGLRLQIRTSLRLFFEGSLLAMVACIALQEIITLPMPWLIPVLSSLLVLSLILIGLDSVFAPSEHRRSLQGLF